MGKTRLVDLQRHNRQIGGGIIGRGVDRDETGDVDRDETGDIDRRRR